MWVLIVTVLSTVGSHASPNVPYQIPTVQFQVFDSEASCNVAAKYVNTNFAPLPVALIVAKCVKK